MAKISINVATGSFQKEDIIVGIDLGTTNSLTAYINADNNPQVINDMGTTLVPSIIYIDKKGDAIVGDEAKKFLVDEPEHTLFSIKRLLGRSYSDISHYQNHFSYKIIDDNTESLVKVNVNDKFYTPIELSAMILKELKVKAEHALKTPVKRAVITVPAYFNDSQRQATRDAGKLAGLDVLRIVNEPTAASLAYGIGLSPDEEKTIAVYDLGGGTFDVSILKIQNGIFEVLSTNGDTFLGGDDFDSAIVDYWLSQDSLSRKDISDKKDLLQLFRINAEKAKKHLSFDCEFETSINNKNYFLDKQTFEELIIDKVNKTLDCCKKAMTDAHLSVSEINTVVMVGGSTRVPLVKRMVSEYFNQEIYDSLNPDEVVALGAAIQADILSGKRKDILLLDVTPLSLGVETAGGLMDTIIVRNSKLPTKAGRQYTTGIDGQVNMRISVYQGERDLVKDNRKLGEFILNNIPAMPAGLPKIDINFLLNADGILTVQAIELRSGVKQHIEIKPQYGLTDEQVEQMLLSSVENAKEDVETRMLVEAKTEAEQMVYTVERFLVKNITFLSKEEIDNTKKLVEDLKNVMNNGSKDQIHLALDTINDYTRPFAERVMDAAISQAMKGTHI